jgi:hypothetical protein
MKALLGDDPKTGCLDHRIHLAGQVPPRRIWLDNRKSAFGCHRGLLRVQVRAAE